MNVSGGYGIQPTSLQTTPPPSTLDIDTLFAATFTPSNLVPRRDKLQALSLFLQIQTSVGQRSPIQQGNIDAIHDELHKSGEKVIPFLNTHNMEESLKEVLSQYPGITARLATSVTTWKGNVWGAKERTEFIVRMEKKTKVPVTKEVSMKQQEAGNMAPKYRQSEICFDPASGEFITSRLTDLDHMDPWSKITERVQAFLKVINGLPNLTGPPIIRELLENYKGYFIRDSSGTIQATQYLGMCLYNFNENLMSMNHAVNIKKSDKDAVEWLATHEQFGQKFIAEVSTAPGAKLNALVDQSGFIYVLKKTGNMVKPEYEGKGLAQASARYAMLGKEKQSMETVAQENIKNMRLIQSTKRLQQLLPLTQDQKGELDKAIEDLGKSLKHTGKRLRNELRRQVGTATGGQSKTESEQAESSSSSSDEEIVTLRKKTKIQQEELVQKDEALAQKDVEIAQLRELLKKSKGVT